MIIHESRQPIASGTTAVAHETRIKVCGVTNVDDALSAAELGAHAIGLIFAPSHRQIDVNTAAQIVRALPPFVITIGVFLNESLDTIRRTLDVVRPYAVQLHGDESPDFCASVGRPVIKRFNIAPDDTTTTLKTRISQYDVAGHLLDPGAGDGRAFDWTLAAGLSDRLILAGGLNPDNIADALRIASPSAVDVCSGVESEPGRKDRNKLHAFVQEIRHHDADTNAQ